MKKIMRLLCLLLALTCLASCANNNGTGGKADDTVPETETDAPQTPQEPLTLIEGGKTK